MILEKIQPLEAVEPLEATELVTIEAMNVPVPENVQTPPGRETISKAHATTMNGVRIHHESYGIFGEMIVNRNDVKVFGGDEIFVTAEPKNLAPLEFLTYYAKDKAPSLWVYDWGRPATDRWKYIASLGDNNFINDFTHVKTTPNNDKVRVVVFQNYYNEKFNCNMVDLLHTNGKFF
ncbi:MAG: hypothetical protein IPJ81_17080 [Chitinophagaceae bacterium]|nr:hypothetical protein [Chitinophagaceae bacterium]